MAKATRGKDGKFTGSVGRKPKAPTVAPTRPAQTSANQTETSAPTAADVYRRFRTVVDGAGREVPRFDPNGPGKTSSERAACGTQAGYNAHRRRKEPTCPECRAANSQAKRKRAANQKDEGYVKPVRHPAACGTRSGYNKHYRQGEKPCDACRSAYNVGQRARDHAREAETGKPRDPWN